MIKKLNIMIKKLNKFSIPIAIVLAGLLIAGAVVFANLKGEKNVPTSASQETLAQQIGEKTIDYINENLLGAEIAAVLVEAVEEDGLVKMKMKIGEEEFDSYATFNGKYLFPQVINMEEKIAAPEEEEIPEASKSKSCEEVKKADKPILQAFVVSKCPYGTQMQRILIEIVKNIPELKENIRIEYMGSISENKITAMHGEEEAQENLRQICLREEQGDKFWNYLSCYIKKGEIDKCLKESKTDLEKLESCMLDSSKGLEYAKQDFIAQDKYKVSGSPTLILNEESEGVSEFSFGGRTAEAVKTLLCCGFKEKPQFCSQELDTRSAAASFSEEYSSESSGSGACK